MLAYNLEQAVDALRQKEVEPICLKGWSLERFYPDSIPRRYSDIDLAIAPDAFDQRSSEISDVLAGLPVDLHRGLRDRDSVDWEVLFRHSYLAPLDRVDIRVLADEDNLRITSAHFMIDGVVSKERLWDIFYLVQNRKNDFDWSRCLNAAGPVRKTWVLAAIALAREHLQLEVDDLPDEVRSFELPKWFRRAAEREWARGEYLRIPLRACLRQPKRLFEQIWRRFPPNPIAATTDVEGPIDDTPRLKYQIKSVNKKLRAAAKNWSEQRSDTP